MPETSPARLVWVFQGSAHQGSQVLSVFQESAHQGSQVSSVSQRESVSQASASQRARGSRASADQWVSVGTPRPQEEWKPPAWWNSHCQVATGFV